MSSVAIKPSYMPDEAETTLLLPGVMHPRALSEKFALVIPTLREAGNIRAVLDRVSASLDLLDIDYEIIVVDDDSQDGIAEIVSSISLEKPHIRILTRTGEKGLSGAVLHGWQHTDATILGVMDADLQHPPELLIDLVLESLKGWDLVIASRYTEGGRLDSWNPLRRLFSVAAVWATVPIQQKDARAKDPMSGFFLVRRSSVDHLILRRTGFKLLLEILVRGRLESVTEIPFAFGRRYAGASKANFQVALDYAALLLKLYTNRIFGSEQRYSAEAES